MDDLQTIHCPGCGRRLEVAPGSQLACPDCGQHLIIETAAPPVVPSRPAPAMGMPYVPTKFEYPSSPIPGISPTAWSWIKALMISAAFIAGGLAIAGAARAMFLSGSSDLFLPLIGSGLLVLLYFAPTISAVFSRHPYASGIGIVNLFLGWTLIGWVVAAAWAASVPRRRD